MWHSRLIKSSLIANRGGGKRSNGSILQHFTGCKILKISHTIFKMWCCAEGGDGETVPEEQDGILGHRASVFFLPANHK